jgi:hypothetical protein
MRETSNAYYSSNHVIFLSLSLSIFAASSEQVCSKSTPINVHKSYGSRKEQFHIWNNPYKDHLRPDDTPKFSFCFPTLLSPSLFRVPIVMRGSAEISAFLHCPSCSLDQFSSSG